MLLLVVVALIPAPVVVVAAAVDAGCCGVGRRIDLRDMPLPTATGEIGDSGDSESRSSAMGGLDISA